jgi:hypothetical protein
MISEPFRTIQPTEGTGQLGSSGWCGVRCFPRNEDYRISLLAQPGSGQRILDIAKIFSPKATQIAVHHFYCTHSRIPPNT